MTHQFERHLRERYRLTRRAGIRIESRRTEKRFKGDSPAPPTPIDPTATANAQADANIKAAQATAALNRVDQSTPTGQVHWSQDPTTGKWAQATTLAPGQDNLNNWANATAGLGLAGLQNVNPLTYGTATPTLQTGIQNPGVPVTSLFGSPTPSQPSPGSFGAAAGGVNSGGGSPKGGASSLPPSPQAGGNQPQPVSAAQFAGMGGGAQSMADGLNQQLASMGGSRQPDATVQADDVRANPQGGSNPSALQPIPQANDAAYQKAVQSVYGQNTSRLDPQFEQAQTQLETKLANQGVPQNSDAWNKAMDEFSRGKNDAYSTAFNNAVTQGSQLENNQFGMGLQANQAGVSNALAEGNFANSAAGQQLAQALAVAGFGNTARQQGFSNAQQNALLNNSSVQNRTQDLLSQGSIGNLYSNIQMPGVSQSNVAAPDVLGANSLAAQQQMANYQNQTAQNSAKKGGTGSLLGTLGSAAILSDRRIKRDIQVIGETANGLPVYSFRYGWDDHKHIGLMAQDVEKIAPHAVIVSGGIKHVDYAKALAA